MRAASNIGENISNLNLPAIRYNQDSRFGSDFDVISSKTVYMDNHALYMTLCTAYLCAHVVQLACTCTCSMVLIIQNFLSFLM